MSLALIAMALGGPKIQIPVDSVTDEFIGGAQATISFESDGDVSEATVLGGVIDVGDWIVPKAAAPGAYTIRADVVSGSLSSGSNTGEDLALSTTRSWTVTSVSGTQQCVLTISIKLGSTVLASGNITLSATAL